MKIYQWFKKWLDWIFIECIPENEDQSGCKIYTNFVASKEIFLVYLFNPKGKTNMEMGYKRRISVMFFPTTAISSSILHVVSFQIISLNI